MRVLVLGAGFGGLEVTSRLSEEFGDSIEIVLIDSSDAFYFGFSKLDVMFGRTYPESVRMPYASLDKPGVQFVQAQIERIDPTTRTVQTSAGTFTGDVMLVALGADYDIDATPGLAEAGTEFYSFAGAFAARDVLANFGGGRVVVGVTSTPFKCPPAPSETALLMHDFLTAKGIRESSEIALVMPLPSPVPPSPDASKAILDAFAERDIAFHPGTVITSLDADRGVAITADGSEMPFDLFLGVPKHVAPEVLQQSGLCVDGWVPVDPHTMATAYPAVYAVGDCTSVGTPKAGVFSEGQGAIAAQQIAGLIRGDGASTQYDGHGICYVEFGHNEIVRVDIYFPPGEGPHGTLTGPAEDLVAEKADFGTSRAKRWFDLEWTAY